MNQTVLWILIAIMLAPGTALTATDPARLPRTDKEFLTQSFRVCVEKKDAANSDVIRILTPVSSGTLEHLKKRGWQEVDLKSCGSWSPLFSEGAWWTSDAEYRLETGYLLYWRHRGTFWGVMDEDWEAILWQRLLRERAHAKK